MRKSKKNIGSNLAQIDAHVIQPEEYDEIPELTEEWFEQADLYYGGKLIRRGRPRKAVRKAALNMRVDADILAAFRATGRGWQTRINEALKEWVARHPNS